MTNVKLKQQILKSWSFVFHGFGTFVSKVAGKFHFKIVQHFWELTGFETQKT